MTSDTEAESTRALLDIIYNSYRQQLLNSMYYTARLATYRKYNLWMELAIAVGATGSGGIATLAIWGSITGQYAWLTISGVAALLGVIKPVLQLSKEIEKFTGLSTGHSSVYYDLKHLAEDIAISRSIPQGIVEKFSSIRERVANLGFHPAAHSHTALIQKLQAQVNDAIPLEKLWYPGSDAAGRPGKQQRAGASPKGSTRVSEVRSARV
jgi:hypothetical protein